MLQDAAIPTCPAKVSTEASMTEDVGLNERVSPNVITSLPCSEVELTEDWKHSETEDFKIWKEEAPELATTAILAHSNDSQHTGELLTTVSDTAVCDMRQVKTEQALNYSTVGSSASSETRSSRVIASIAPCTLVQPSEQRSLWKVPLPGLPPPLLHSTSHDQSSPSPLPTSVIQSPMITDETSPLAQNDSDDSEQDLRNHTPSPEPRLVNEECCRSKNAMYVLLFHFIF